MCWHRLSPMCTPEAAKYQRAKNRKESTVEITLVLQTARDVERAAVHACDDHVEKHGCKL